MKKILLTLTLCLTLTLTSFSTEIERHNKLERFINEWFYIPYKWGGTTKKGIDCSAFIQKIYNSVYNMDIPRTCREQYKKCIKISKDSLDIGDLVFFKMGKDKWHVGIYLIEKQFAHVSVSQGVTISSLDGNYWKKYYFSSGKVS